VDGDLGDIVGSGTPINPRLGALANNGGPTLTCALLAGSPAIDAGDDTLLNAPLSLAQDQRGQPRQFGLHVDVGAFELRRASMPILLTDCVRTTSGAIQLILTNDPGATFEVLAATNPAAPLSGWAVVGSVTEAAPGQFQFIDPASTNLSRRFYRLRSP
jgi:hypothetical protein